MAAIMQSSTFVAAQRRATIGASLRSSSLKGASLSMSSRSRQKIAVRRVATCALEPDNIDILVAGGGGVAFEVVKKLKNAGAWVTFFQRSTSRQDQIEKMGALMHMGNALDKENVNAAWTNMDDCKLVVSSLGGTPADPTVDEVGNINLIDAAIANGVERFVLVTSIGAGNTKDAPPPQVYETLKPILQAKEKAEDYLMKNHGKMEYVIIRPGGLQSDPETKTGVLTEDTSICGAITRGDVAQLVYKACFSAAAKNKVYSAVDKAQLYQPKDFEISEL